jgi:PadR family transcriptional regulator, regulatory protein PadR
VTTPRISPQTGLLLQALLEEPAQWRYGYDLSQQIGLKSGTLYPILMRLAKHYLLETRWEEPTNSGRPPRHMYRLTGAGQRVAREERRTTPRRGRLKQAYGER